MLRTVLVNLLVLLLMLAGAEGGLVWLSKRSAPTGIGPLDSMSRNIYWGEVRLIQFNSDCARYDEQLFYILRPGACTFANPGFSTTVSVNSAGLRDDEASLDAPEVIVLGDSQAMGWGVEDDQTFAQVIEATTGLKTLNAGVSSYGTAREVTLLDRLDTSALRFLVVQFSDNDHLENIAFLDAGGELLASSEDEYLSRIEKGYSGYRPFAGLWSLIKPLFPGESGGDPAGSAMKSGEAFARVLAQSRLPDHPVTLIAFDVSLNARGGGFIYQVDGSRDMLEQAFADIHILDPQKLLQPGDFLFPDGHMNASGHAKIANAVGAVIGHPNQRSP